MPTHTFEIHRIKQHKNSKSIVAMLQFNKHKSRPNYMFATGADPREREKISQFLNGWLTEEDFKQAFRVVEVQQV